MKRKDTPYLEHEEDILNKMADSVLLIGSTIAIVLIGVGIVLFRVHSDQFPLIIGKSFHQALQGAIQLKGTGITNLGIFMLMVTPFLRVITCMIGFFLLRWWRFTLVSMFVFGVLLISMYFRASI